MMVRRPRVSPELRLKILSIRGETPGGQPPSADTILERLSQMMLDDDQLDWQLPSRPTVNRIIKEWETLPEPIRFRDMPFQWHRIEDARLPCEASAYVLDCARAFHAEFVRVVHIPGVVAEDTPVDLVMPQFTNRWAYWCWRVHQAAPDLPESFVLCLADEYERQERASDLVPNHPSADVEALNAWLTFRPDRSAAEAKLYEKATASGVIPSVQRYVEGYLPEPLVEAKAVEQIVQALRAEPRHPGTARRTSVGDELLRIKMVVNRARILSKRGAK